MKKEIENKEMLSNAEEDINSQDLPIEEDKLPSAIDETDKIPTQEELHALCLEYKQVHELADIYSKEMEEKKTKLKEMCLKMEIDHFTESDVSIKILEIDRSYLDEKQTLEYLRKNKLKKFIHTKEFFDYAELAMAAARKEIPAEDLAKLVVKKIDRRLYVK